MCGVVNEIDSHEWQWGGKVDRDKRREKDEKPGKKSLVRK